MKKQFLLSIFSIISCILIFYTILNAGVLSNGAPIAHTNAPGENNCSQSGCHSDHKVNSGIGTVSIYSDSAISEYQIGKTYTFHVKVSQKNLIRFGFQLTAITDKDSSNAGNILVADYRRTQTMSEAITFNNRNYLTYTFDGSSAATSGSNEWTFNWTAPKENVGNISFYIAGVAADNDQTDKGDYTYTTKLQLTPSSTSGIKDNLLPDEMITIYPNPVSSYFTINGLDDNTYADMKLLNIEGKIVQQFERAKLFKNAKFQLDSKLPKGIYFLTISSESKIITKKIIIY